MKMASLTTQMLDLSMLGKAASFQEDVTQGQQMQTVPVFADMLKVMMPQSSSSDGKAVESDAVTDGTFCNVDANILVLDQVSTNQCSSDSSVCQDIDRAVVSDLTSSAHLVLVADKGKRLTVDFERSLQHKELPEGSDLVTYSNKKLGRGYTVSDTQTEGKLSSPGNANTSALSACDGTRDCRPGAKIRQVKSTSSDAVIMQSDSFEFSEGKLQKINIAEPLKSTLTEEYSTESIEGDQYVESDLSEPDNSLQQIDGDHALITAPMPLQVNTDSKGSIDFSEVDQQAGVNVSSDTAQVAERRLADRAILNSSVQSSAQSDKQQVAQKSGSLARRVTKQVISDNQQSQNTTEKLYVDADISEDSTKSLPLRGQQVLNSLNENSKPQQLSVDVNSAKLNADSSTSNLRMNLADKTESVEVLSYQTKDKAIGLTTNAQQFKSAGSAFASAIFTFENNIPSSSVPSEVRTFTPVSDITTKSESLKAHASQLKSVYRAAASSSVRGSANPQFAVEGPSDSTMTSDASPAESRIDTIPLTIVKGLQDTVQTVEDGTVANNTDNMVIEVIMSSQKNIQSVPSVRDIGHRKSGTDTSSSSEASVGMDIRAIPVRRELVTDHEIATSQLYDNIMSQVKSGTVHHDGKGNGAMTVRLHPEDLGELKVNVRIENQQVKIEIVTENRVVRDVLLGNMDNLKDNFMKQNINVERFDVLTGGGADYGHGTKDERGAAKSYPYNNLPDELMPVEVVRSSVLTDQGDTESSLINMHL